MAYTSAWVIGSVRDIDFDFNVGATPVNVAGGFYLHHTTDALSLIEAVAAAILGAGVAGASAALTQDRRVRLTATGTFAVQWTDTVLRDLLGYTGNLAAATSYIAPNVSPLLWSPAKPLLPEMSPLGCSGNTRPLSYWTSSPSDGSTFVVSHGERIDQKYSASHVAVTRVQTATPAGGEWARLFNESLGKGYNFWVWPEQFEQTGSSVVSSLTNGLGPYVLSPQGRSAQWTYRRSRGFEWLDRRADISFDCRIVPEYETS